MTEQIEQRTDEWQAARAGKLTASVFADILATTQSGKPTAARAKLMRLKAFERTAGVAKHEIGGKALTWGREIEPFSKEDYQVHTGNIVTEAGFILHPQFDFIGCSPDGLIGSDGGLEMKSPHDEQVHVLTWLEGMPDEHIPQVQGCMYVTGRRWWDFVSYDPRAGERFRLYVQRIHRDEEYITSILEPGLLQFEMELRAMIQTLEEKAA